MGGDFHWSRCCGLERDVTRSRGPRSRHLVTTAVENPWESTCVFVLGGREEGQIVSPLLVVVKVWLVLDAVVTVTVGWTTGAGGVRSIPDGARSFDRETEGAEKGTEWQGSDLDQDASHNINIRRRGGVVS